MALKFWINANGKVCMRDGKVLLCETSPCVTGPDLPCCPDGESPGETLTFAWASSEFDGEPGPGGSATLFYNADLFVYEGTYGDPNISDTFLVNIACTGAADGREFAMTGSGVAPDGGSATTLSCTTFLLEFGALSATGVSTLFDVTVSN